MNISPVSDILICTFRKSWLLALEMSIPLRNMLRLGVVIGAGADELAWGGVVLANASVWALNATEINPSFTARFVSNFIITIPPLGHLWSFSASSFIISQADL